jgi:hypothetical protein
MRIIDIQPVSSKKAVNVLVSAALIKNLIAHILIFFMLGFISLYFVQKIPTRIYVFQGKIIQDGLHENQIKPGTLRQQYSI